MTTTVHSMDEGRAHKRRPLVRALQVVASIAVVVATLTFGFIAIGALTGEWRIVPVRTGSMRPLIDPGDAVYATPQSRESLRKGDVILFRAPTDGRPLTVHRIYGVGEKDGEPTFRTKGDANAGPDPWTVTLARDDVYVVRHVVPKAGLLVLWAVQPATRVFVLVAGGGLVVAYGLYRIWGRRDDEDGGDDPVDPVDETPPGTAGDPVDGEPDSARAAPPEPEPEPVAPVRRRAAPTGARGRSALPVQFGIVVAVLGLVSTSSALALFSATPVPPTPSYSTGSLDDPSPLTCRWNNATQVALSWANNSPPFTTGYDVARSATTGGPYGSIATVNDPATTTYTHTPASPATPGYYVVTATHGTWSSGYSNEMGSQHCVNAVRAFAGNGASGFSGDGGAATSARLNRPQEAAADPSGNLYVADTNNNRIRKIDPSGNITTIAGGGANTGCGYSGPATSARLALPQGIAVDAGGSLYIADTNNNCVRKVDPGGNISLLAGTGATTACNSTGAAAAVSMSGPRSVAVDASGNVYVADTGRNCIRRITAGSYYHLAGGGATTTCNSTGPAGAVSLSAPSGVAVDASGTNVYVADTNRVCVRKVSAGTYSHVAGGGATTGCTTSGAATAVSLSAPGAVSVDGSGRVFIADTGRRCVRMVSAGSYSWVGFTGGNSSSGDNGPVFGATIRIPASVALDAAGNIYVTDQSAASGSSRVRVIVGPTP